jgi:hypothetical protein
MGLPALYSDGTELCVTTDQLAAVPASANMRNLIRRAVPAAALFSQQRDASKPLVSSAEAGQ